MNRWELHPGVPGIPSQDANTARLREGVRGRQAANAEGGRGAAAGGH
jgi:hypothetical protein